MSSAHPYTFNADDADVVLRSSEPEPREFKVHKCILAAGSPFFETMFSLPQRPTTDMSKPSPVAVSETHETLELLLRFLYPLPDPIIRSLDQLTPVLEAASKYELNSVTDRLRTILISTTFLSTAPTRVYAIASRFELEDEARIASKATLCVSVLDSPLCDDLKFITAYSYHRLLDLHRRRGQAAVQMLAKAPFGIKCMQCNGSNYGSPAPPLWWNEWSKRAMDELGARPTTEVVFAMQFLSRSAGAVGCTRCAGSVLDSYDSLDSLKARIDALPSTI